MPKPVKCRSLPLFEQPLLLGTPKNPQTQRYTPLPKCNLYRPPAGKLSFQNLAMDILRW